MNQLHTPRLLLRRWGTADFLPFAEMNADPEVMTFFPGVLSRQESDSLIERFERHFEEHGYGLWAVEILADKKFIGAVGLIEVGFDAHFTPAIEVGWRLCRSAWSQGYALEAAREACRFGFEQLGLEQIVSFTTPDNLRSRRVMERLGMSHDPGDDFDHPRLPEGHRLRRHVLYRLEKQTRASVVP